MKNYVVTGFNEPYWKQWGSSWLISLLEFAKFDPKQILITGFNLSLKTRKTIIQTGVSLICKDQSDNIRFDTIKSIIDLAIKEPAIFAYWDADAFFQEDISDIFKIAKNDLFVSSNLKHGFLVGPSHQWMYIQDVINFMSFFNDKSNLHNCLTNHFKKIVFTTDDTWNFTDVGRLENHNSKLQFKNTTQKVIHPTGEIKRNLETKNILFWERHKELHKSFFHKKISNKFVAVHKKI